MSTTFISKEDVNSKWYLVDAKNQILGRVASQVASILMGKHKADFSTHLNTGDNVVVINSADIVLSGNKAQTKSYFTHSTYPGGAKIVSFSQAMKKDPTHPLVHAVEGMLPKNGRGKKIAKNLFVYADDKHKHIAQKPELLTF